MKNMKGDKKMTQKNKSSSFGLSFSNALASQRWDLCVITHDLYNDFSHRHLLVSRLFSKVSMLVTCKLLAVKKDIIINRYLLIAVTN